MSTPQAAPVSLTPEAWAKIQQDAHDYTERFFARGRRLRALLEVCRPTRRERLLEALAWWNDELQDTIS